ncbi:MAG: ABC transporter permease [Candidatus Aminicenantes bacterium]|nr:ABC transporter permease [Candidatus Aminicenantes bacterium]
MDNKSPQPPGMAVWLLKRFFPDETGLYTQLGDIDEAFNAIAKRKGNFAAQAWYWITTLRLIPYIIKNSIIWNIIMLKNYFKIALRNIFRQKQSSLINIIGLSVGMACCILIFVYVDYELGYDQYHPDADRIYRATTHFKIADGDFYRGSSPGPMAAALKRDYAEVAYACMVIPYNRILVEVEGNFFSEEHFLYVGNDFFNIWMIEFLEGGPGVVIDRPYTLLLTEDMSRKYFGSSDPTGKTIRLNRQEYEISGIIKNPPPNSHLHYHFLTSVYSYRQKPEEMTEWADCFGQTYLKLRPGVKGEDFKEKIRWIAHQHRGDYFKQRGWTYETVLEPIRSLHLHSRADAGNSMLMIYGISVIGFLILLIACLNFINMTTAGASIRAREVGVRKVIGARRSHLIFQFLGESLTLTAGAFLLAAGLTCVILPYFNQLTDRQFEASRLVQPASIVFMLLLVLLIGTLAGSYPAFFISKSAPASVLSNRSSRGSYKSFLRRILVGVQFVITMILTVSTLTVFNQISFMKNQELGFDKNQKLILEVDFNNNHDFIKSEFLQHPNITGATASYHAPGVVYNSITTRFYGEESKEVILNYYYFDPDFIPEYKIPMVAGRNFDKNLATDLGRSVILNETAVKLLGWSSPEEALGKIIESGGHGEEYNKTIIGVTKDFYYQGLQRPIGPLGMLYRPDYFGALTLNIKIENLPETLAFVKNKWSELHLGAIFSYSFLDENFDRLYAAEEKTGKIFTTFTFLALFLSCLGIFSLSSFVAARRTKEIGIRKVLGATVPKILGLISGEFVWLVMAANLIAWPVSYFLMRYWLGNFAYRIELAWTVFALATVIGLLIALATVSYQSLKAALANPVDSLRYE